MEESQDTCLKPAGIKNTVRSVEVMMPQTDAERFTVGVFKDLAAAEVGLAALKRQGFAADALSVIAREDAQAGGLIENTVGTCATALALPGLGAVLAAGPLMAALEGEGHDLSHVGLATAMKRVGFQLHDGQVFQKLTERGGVLVAVRSESRAADALSTLHCYGGGNAAIGAWTGRLPL